MKKTLILFFILIVTSTFAQQQKAKEILGIEKIVKEARKSFNEAKFKDIQYEQDTLNGVYNLYYPNGNLDATTTFNKGKKWSKNSLF